MELTKTARNGGFLSPVWSDLFNGDRLFDRWFPEPALFSPPVNVIENGTSFRIELAVPGYAKDDFHIDADGNVLSISAEKEESDEDDDERYTRKEFRYTSFARSFTLPQNCDASGIDARYTDGILSLTVPKKEPAERAKKPIAVR